MNRLRRIRHRLFGHPDGATWQGDFVAGCRDCGDLWSVGEKSDA